MERKVNGASYYYFVKIRYELYVCMMFVWKAQKTKSLILVNTAAFSKWSLAVSAVQDVLVENETSLGFIKSDITWAKWHLDGDSVCVFLIMLVEKI